MKTVLKRPVAEVAQYHCDVTGLPLPHGPAAIIILRCGYGTTYDGNVFELDLSEKAADVVLPLLRVLLIDGGPLEPHRTAATLFERSLDEKRISRRERAALLGRLDKLCRGRKRTLATVKTGLSDSAHGRTVHRGSFAECTFEMPDAPIQAKGGRREEPSP